VQGKTGEFYCFFQQHQLRLSDAVSQPCSKVLVVLVACIPFRFLFTVPGGFSEEITRTCKRVAGMAIDLLNFYGFAAISCYFSIVSNRSACDKVHQRYVKYALFL